MNGNIVDLLNFMEATGAVEDAYIWLGDVDVDKRLDKEVLAGTLLRVCGALTPVYHEVQSFMYQHKLWFRIKKLSISHLCDTLDYDYNPLENYDWKEVGNRVNNRRKLSDSESVSTQKTDSSYQEVESINDINFRDTDETEELRHGKTITTNNKNERNLNTLNEHEDENKTSAYNENLYQPDNTTDGTISNHDWGSITDDGKETNSGKDVTVTETTDGYTGLKNRVLEHNANAQSQDADKTSSTAELGHDTEANEKFVMGATGQYTKQQMIDQERMIAKFNIYEWIANEYAKENCYRVY